MKERDVAKLALKKEAHQKPDEKLIVGDKMLTYRELERLIDEGDKWIEQNVLKPFEQLLKESKDFFKEVIGFALSDNSS